ncbi:MAG TPA: hypothetical protein VL980_04895, partial [Gemmatimonadaceae bacterium]|nr:hypothetical protein [Gemmatimonadaceae bacterium]
MSRRWAVTIALVAIAACRRDAAPPPHAATTAMTTDDASLLSQYATVKLGTDTTVLTPDERKMLPLLIDAAREMNAPFWMETYGDKDSLMRHVTGADARQLVEINYGPWNRLANNAPFVPEIGAKPAGANYYPAGMTKEEFDSAAATSRARGDSLRSLYTMVRRDANGRLTAVPYAKMFAKEHEAAARKLLEAAKLAKDPGLRTYLTKRAAALRTDDYQPSDYAWMAMKDNTLDIVIGPIETYEDELFGYKAAHEGVVLVKDKTWSARLAKYTKVLPALQKGLPVADAYKRDPVGTASDLNAYDVLFYAGQANTGAKTIAINLPNDEVVQQKAGTRRLELKNAMRAKFDVILVPIAKALIADDQQALINFDAFFENVMFHEVAHGLGIKNTIDGKGTVRAALKERAGALEEGKADILGLHMVQVLNAQGELGKEDIRSNYVTFLASLFRSMRFSAADAHGRANIAAFNFLQRMGAFTRDSATGR